MDFSQVCVAGPGASGISVDGLPPLPDPDALDSQGQALAASGNAVHSGVNDAAKSWAGLSSAYEAPEAGQVLTAFNPVFSRSQDLANLTSNAATVLAAYADRARELKQRINTLRAEVHALDELIGGNDDWRSNLTIVDRHRDTMDKASALAQAILDSDATCATALAALTGGQSYHPPTIPRANLNSSTDMTANGFTHVQHFMGNDEKLPDLPWGPPNISVRLGGAGSAGQGFTSALIGAFQGLHTLLFTTDTAKQVQAWQGMFALGAAALTTRNVFARGGKDVTPDEAQAVLTTVNVAKETIHYDEWGTDPGYAIGATTFDVGSMFIGGTGLGIKGASLGGKLGAETAALTKAATTITGATRTMLGETTTAVTAKLAQARVAIWDHGVGTALDKLDNGLAKLNQTLNGPQPALAGVIKIPEPGSPLQGRLPPAIPETGGLTDHSPTQRPGGGGQTGNELGGRDTLTGSPGGHHHADVGEVPSGTHPFSGTDDGPFQHPDDSPTPKDQLYGKPLSGHAEHAAYPELTDQNRKTMDLVSDPDAPWGRSDNGSGTPLTKDDYDKRYAVPSRDGPSAWDNYPPNAGAVRGSRQDFHSLEKFVHEHGDRLDRVGNPNGSYLGVMEHGKAATFEARSLPVNSLGKSYFQYKWAKEWPPGTEGWTIELSKIAPAFGRKGGSRQVLVRDESGIAVPVNELLRMGVLS